MSAVLVCRTSYGIHVDLSCDQETKIQQKSPKGNVLNGVLYTILSHYNTMQAGDILWYNFSILVEINEKQLTAIEISSSDISAFINNLIHDILEVDIKLINPAISFVSSHSAIGEALHEIQFDNRN